MPIFQPLNWTSAAITGLKIPGQASGDAQPAVGCFSRSVTGYFPEIRPQARRSTKASDPISNAAALPKKPGSHSGTGEADT